MRWKGREIRMRRNESQGLATGRKQESCFVYIYLFILGIQNKYLFRELQVEMTQCLEEGPHGGSEGKYKGKFFALCLCK